MANERLRQAITEAGLDPERVADLVEVDVKSVYRWLAGTIPHARRRARLLKALNRSEHELWPEIATQPPPGQHSGEEIVGAWVHADDPGAPDWQELLDESIGHIELLDYSLLDVLKADGVVDTLATKAGAGCRVRIVISAPDSIWVRARAYAIGQVEEDHIGRSQLAVDIETARGYLEPLTGIEGVEPHQLYADPGYRILRFDDEMLISPHLQGRPSPDAPVLHLRRRHDRGLFDQFASHLDALTRDAAHPIEPMPELYPDPRSHSDRYGPLTADRYEQLNELRRRDRDNPKRVTRPIEQVRAEIRRPDPKQ